MADKGFKYYKFFISYSDGESSYNAPSIFKDSGCIADELEDRIMQAVAKANEFSFYDVYYADGIIETVKVKM